MNTITLVEQVLEAHEVTAVLTGPFGDQAHLTVAIPDLRSAPREVWGDWGPMVSVTIPEGLELQATIQRPGQPPTSQEPLEVTEVTLRSPMAASRREVSPFVMTIPLPHLGSSLEVSYGPEGRPCAAELRPLSGAGQGLGGIVRLHQQAPTVGNFGRERPARAGAGEELRHAS